MKKILIIGGGFAGVYTAKYLLKQIKKENIDAEVTMINNTNYFLFTPMLHEVATGGISRDNIIQPIHRILNDDRFSFLKGTVKNIDTKKKVVLADSFKTPYDILVLATGSRAHYFDVPGAEEYTLPLRTLHDAYKIRNQVIEKIERAEETNDTEKRKKMLTFVIIGGGATGIELAGELAEYIDAMLKSKYKRVKKEEISIQLIHRGEEILNMLPRYYAKKCRVHLESLGVKIHLKCGVKEVKKTYVVGCDKHIANTIIWAAGFRSNTVKIDGDLPEQYKVDDYFGIIGKKDVFALGDCAKLEYFDKRVPMLAQVAVKQSEFVTHNVLHALGEKKEPRNYKHKLDGFLLSVGQYYAAGGLQFFGKDIHFSGFFAWWMWRTIYLAKLIGIENKIRVAIDWTLNFFYPRDTSEVGM